MNDVLLDRLELSFLSGLQDQREVQQRVREGTRIGLGMATANGQTRPAEVDDMGITNRSPTIHNHYQSAPIVEPTPPPAPVAKPVNPWPWIAFIATVLALASGWAVWTLGHQAKPVNPGQYGLGLDDLKVF